MNKLKAGDKFADARTGKIIGQMDTDMSGHIFLEQPIVLDNKHLRDAAPDLFTALRELIEAMEERTTCSRKEVTNCEKRISREVYASERALKKACGL